MTDRDTGGSPEAPAGQAKPRLNIWPLAIVVGLPLLAAVLRLPVWVSLLLLLAGVAFLVFGRRLKAERQLDPKPAWTHLLATYTKLQSEQAALQESPADAAAQKRFSKLLAECLSLLDSRADSDWGSDSRYVAKVREEVVKLSASSQRKAVAPAPAPEVGRLEDLRKRGLISEEEFLGLSERLKALVVEKACGVLEMVAGLQLQCHEGAITEEDFHLSLRALLERLDRGNGDAALKPATPS